MTIRYQPIVSQSMIRHHYHYPGETLYPCHVLPVADPILYHAYLRFTYCITTDRIFLSRIALFLSTRFYRIRPIQVRANVSIFHDVLPNIKVGGGNVLAAVAERYEGDVLLGTPHRGENAITATSMRIEVVDAVPV